MTVSGEACTAPATARLRVGRWDVERDLNQLSASGRTVRIEPKAMAVLVYLADRHGRVVSRSSLLSAVWPDTVVGDDCLTQVVVKLRKALGDIPGQPTYIQTIAKGGYRLVAAVSDPDAEDPAAATVAPTARAPPPRASWRPLRWAAAAVLVAFGAWWMLETTAVREPEHAARPAGRTRVVADGPTVAIRPFAALSNDPDEAMLAHGITTDLITDLSKISGLWVVDADSAAGGQAGQAPADRVSIQYLVSGTVQQLDGHLRLHVNLSETASGRLLWSERFDRDVSGLFAVQDELGSKLLHLLPAKVTEAEMRRVSRRYSRSLEAYRHFQRGQMALLAREQRENEAARAAFQRAIDLDARFARARAGLALTYAADYRNQWVKDGAAALERAFEIATAAIQIDPDIAETHWVLAFVHMERRQHDLALQHVQAAVRVNPSYADGYGLIGSIETYVGRPDDALRSLRAAMRLGQGSGQLQLMNLGRAYFFLGDLVQARSSLEGAVSRNPANLEVHVYLAALHVMRGDTGAARWEAEEIRLLKPGFSSRAWLRTYPMTDRAQQDKLVTSLATLGL